MFKKIIIYVALVFLLSTSYYLLTTNSHALELQSPRYQLEIENIDINVKEKPAFYTLGTRFGQNWSDLFNTQGYLIKKGVKTIVVDLSQNLIDLDELKSGKEARAGTTISILQSPDKGYQISLIQLYLLKNSNGVVIEATRCNDGDQTCNSSLAKKWTTSSAFGLGYNQSGQNTPSDFKNASYFRPMPNENAGNLPNSLLFSLDGKKRTPTQLTFKLNPPSGLAGTFETVVNFIVLPNY